MLKFIGPYHCGRIWEGWGVPKNVSSLLNPGDTIELKDMKIHAIESFDRTLVTLPVNGADETGGELAGLAVTDEEMAQRLLTISLPHQVEPSIMVQILTSQTILQNMVKTLKLMLLLNNYGEKIGRYPDKNDIYRPSSYGRKSAYQSHYPSSL